MVVWLTLRVLVSLKVRNLFNAKLVIRPAVRPMGTAISTELWIIK